MEFFIITKIDNVAEFIMEDSRVIVGLKMYSKH